MLFGMGVLNRNDLLALKIEKNAYLHETVWVETTASTNEYETVIFKIC